MTAASNNGFAPEGTTAIPASFTVPLQASTAASAGAGQYMVYNASGYAAPTDGATPCVVAAGVVWPAKSITGGTNAGDETGTLWAGFGGKNPCSTGSNDNFTLADVVAPAYAFDVNTLGKKSNLSGTNRPLMGLVFGVYPDGSPRAWVGPLAQTVARSLLVTNAFNLAGYTITDAAANTTTAERVILRAKVHGLVTSVEFTGAAIAANDTDYITVTISKRDGAGGGAVVMATYDSRAASQGAVTAFTPAAFALSAVAHALELLETDVVTLTVVKGGAGKVMTGAILVNGKAI